MDRLYAELPAIECRRLCTQACGPIAMSKLEWQRIRTRIGRPPQVDECLTCSLLSGDRCSARDIRPLICRLFGLVDNELMRCPFGCVPTRWLSDAEARRFLNRAAQIGGAARTTLET